MRAMRNGANGTMKVLSQYTMVSKLSESLNSELAQYIIILSLIQFVCYKRKEDEKTSG